jgi:hypothetical protein
MDASPLVDSRFTHSISSPCFIKPESLGGVVVSVFVIGPMVCRFKSSRGKGFLRVIKIGSTPSFVGEVNLEASCRKIYGMKNKPCVV